VYNFVRPVLILKKAKTNFILQTSFKL